MNFCPETPGYNKLKLIGNLFRFFKNLRPKVVFLEDTGIATNNSNTVYDKTQERTDISKQLKNRSFEDHCDKLNQYISINNGITNLCNKKYINHQQKSVDEKLAIKNFQANQDIMIHSADKHRRMQKSTIGQYFL